MAKYGTYARLIVIGALLCVSVFQVKGDRRSEPVNSNISGVEIQSVDMAGADSEKYKDVDRRHDTKTNLAEAMTSIMINPFRHNQELSGVLTSILKYGFEEANLEYPIGFKIEF